MTRNIPKLIVHKHYISPTQAQLFMTLATKTLSLGHHLMNKVWPHNSSVN